MQINVRVKKEVSREWEGNTMGEKWENAGVEEKWRKCALEEKRKEKEMNATKTTRKGRGKEEILSPGSCMESIPLNYTILYPRWS